MSETDDLQYVTIHGHRRAYVMKGQGPVVLLLHGMGATGDVWLPWAPYLEQHWPGRWLAPDLAGHGWAVVRMMSQPSRFTEPQRRPYNKPRRAGFYPPTRLQLRAAFNASARSVRSQLKAVPRFN